jgi:hypothetical protein
MEAEAKPKRVMSEEALQKLAIAREKANAKRKELAAQRNEEKENLVQEKLEASKAERAAKVNASAEKEARKRLSEVEPPPKKTTKRESIVIERDSSDSSEEDDVRDARVYFVRKNKAERSKVEAPEAPRVSTPDPLDSVFRQMFGGSTNYM